MRPERLAIQAGGFGDSGAVGCRLLQSVSRPHPGEDLLNRRSASGGRANPDRVLPPHCGALNSAGQA